MYSSRPILACCLFLAVLVTRMPLLGIGFGTDPDGWRVVRTAETLAETGLYVPSRFPGYPLTEYVYAGLYALDATDVALWTGATAAMSGVAAVNFYLIYRGDPRRPAPLLAAMAMALVPTLYFESASTMDYVWALAFITGSTLAILRRHVALAGALLGLAIACRLTSAAFIVPAALLICDGGRTLPDPARLRALSVYAATAALTALAFYWPLLAAYGRTMFRFIDTYPAPLTVLHTASLKTFGILGSIACAALLAKAGLRLLARPVASLRALATMPLTLPSVVYIATVLLIFLRLPHEPGYLIPLVPFAMIAIADLAGRRTAMAAFMAFALSPFVFDMGRNRLTLAGPVVREYDTRMAYRQIACSGAAVAAHLPRGHYLLMGQFHPFADFALRDDPEARTRIIYAIMRRVPSGYELYEGPFLPHGVRFHVLEPILPRLQQRGFHVEPAFTVEPLRSCSARLR